MWGKQIVILVSFLLTFCEVESSENATEDCHEFAKSEDENSMKDYSGYQVLKIPHGLDRISIAFLSKRKLHSWQFRRLDGQSKPRWSDIK